jgi:hypothetical protein
MTVKMTSCDYKFILGSTTGGVAHTYGISTQIECSTPGDQIHLEVYSNPQHTNLICTVTFGAQIPPTQHLHATYSTATGKIRIHGQITSIHGIRTNSGGGCPPSGTTSAAEYKLDIEVSGENEAGGATAASVVEDEGTDVTSDGPFFLAGTDEASGNSISYPGLTAVKCPESHYIGTNVGGLEPIPTGSESTTLLPSYTSCKAGVFPITIALNGCHYVLLVGETTGGGDTYAVGTDLICPEGKSMHITYFSDGEHKNAVCTVVLGPQSGLTGLHATDTTNGKLLISGAAGGIKGSRSGSACSSGSTEAAALNANFELSGQNEEAGATTVSISH